MTDQPILLSIDQGTTSSRAMLFEKDGTSLFTSQLEFPQIYPESGWVEHDPEAIWDTVLKVTRDAIKHAADHKRQIAGIGITNQRETTVVWERSTGKPVYNAIVWQDRRTAEYCRDLKNAGHETQLTQQTGLLLDPYFSGTKLRWILDHTDTRERAERGELAFGTIDSFLLWRLTGGKSHATDATNASRTLLYDIRKSAWDNALLELFEIPQAVLPEVHDSASDFGITDKQVIGAAIPVYGIAGDQHAATIGQTCFEPGMVKSTYGTGCFVVLNTGDKIIESGNKLLSTIAYQLNGKPTYAIEGSIFVAGAAVQWLRDSLNIIDTAGETEILAAGLENNQGVYLVPSFTGMGAPYWDPDARGAIFGLTRDSGPATFARAALESVCYQTSDLFRAMQDDGAALSQVRVDGGMVNNNWMAQFLADTLNITVQRPVQTETTALGAAYLAGLKCGIYTSLDDVVGNWQIDNEFKPSLPDDDRQRLLSDWQQAVQKTLSSKT